MNKKRKAASKKTAPRKKKSSKSTPKRQELVIKVQAVSEKPTIKDLAEPIKDGKKLTIPKTWMSEQQIVRMVQRTPPQHIYKRKGKGGQMFDYVTGSYVEKVLNYVFGWNWDFEVQEHGREGDFVWVLGRLIVRGGEGQQIVKTQFGRAEVKYLKGTKNFVDFGNDLKAATTDALKKCASLLGIASDIYGKADYKQETGEEVKENGVALPPPQDFDGEKVWTCSKCDSVVSQQVAEFSNKIYKKTLCRECQPKKA